MGKNILFLTPHVPSQRAGGENFTRQLLEHLSKNNKIDLLYFRYSEDPLYICPNSNIKIVKEIVNSTSLKLKNFILRPYFHPIFSIRFNWFVLKFLRNLVKRNNYDLIYLDHSQMALYGKYFPNIKKIYMSHDVMIQRFSRRGNFIVSNLIKKAEGNLMKQPNTYVFTFSDKDKKIISDVYGIDSYVTNFFLDKNVINAKPTNLTNSIIFFGKWKRADNFDGLKWFFENVYGNLSQELSIKIIGKWLPADFIRKIKDFPNVEYLGFVDNPYDIISNSLAVISPLFSGAGVKVKVVESLACGTPVIGNEIAFEGISKDFSSFMLKAHSPQEYIDKINSLNFSLTDRQQYKDNFIRRYQKESIINFIETIE